MIHPVAARSPTALKATVARYVFGLVISATAVLAPALAEAAFYDETDMAEFLDEAPDLMPESTQVVVSNMHDIAINWIALPKHRHRGGGLFAIDGLILAVRQDGSINWLHLEEEKGPFDTTIRAPMNREALLASGLDETAGVRYAWHRVTGIYAEDAGAAEGKLRLYIIHHVYEDECFYLQISAVGVGFDRTEGLVQRSEWEQVHRFIPCVKVRDATGRAFAGHQAGGRIVPFDNDHFLVTVGDHEIDGRTGGPMAPQDPDSPYGKAWIVAKDGSAARVFASGLRNPQGLIVADDGRIWESEHGPQGGDELNLLEEGANYGWPLETHGVLYNDGEWPLNEKQGRHEGDGFRMPVFSWVPSIAPTNLAQISGPVFPHWEGDLLLTTLKDRALHRIRPSGDRIAYTERMEVGLIMRDVISLPDGRMAVLSDGSLIGILENNGRKLRRPGEKSEDLPAKLVAIDEETEDEEEATDDQTAAADAAVARLRKGADLFDQQCAACHRLDAQHDAGPSLKDIVGRGVGTAPDFTYSASLADSTEIWTRRSLINFLSDPAGMLPDNAMATAAQSRPNATAIVDYLIAGGQPTAPTVLAPSSIDAMVATIDQTILSLMKGRERTIAALSGEASTAEDPSISSSASPTIFDQPLAFPVGRGKEFLPGYSVSYQADSDTRILASQIPDPTEANASLLRLQIEDPGGSSYVVVRKRLDDLITDGPMDLRVAFRARSNLGGRIRVVLSVRSEDGDGDTRFEIGRVPANKQMTAEFMTLPVNLSELGKLRDSHGYLLLFVPAKPGTLDIAYLEAFSSRAQE